ncbi:MAG: hypothetical protein AB1714_07990 [Acidobacteriota bacterium]
MSMQVPRYFYWIMIAVCAVVVVLISRTPFCRSEKPEAIRAAVEIVEFDSYWAEKSSRPGEVVMVPVISFKVRNKRAEPLQYLQFSSVFALEGDSQNLGDAFAYSIGAAPLRSGQLSETVILKSNYGYRASSKQAFQNNPGFKSVYAKVFAQSRASGPVLVGTFKVSKKIEGMAVPAEESQRVLEMKVK